MTPLKTLYELQSILIKYLLTYLLTYLRLHRRPKQGMGSAKSSLNMAYTLLSNPSQRRLLVFETL